MTNPTPTTAAVQSLTATGWCPPTGHDMCHAVRVVAPRRWRRRRTDAQILAELRDWVWSDTVVASSRAQAARVACFHAGIGTACPTCTGSGVDPTGRPNPLPFRTNSSGVPIQQPRCRVCAGIGLLAAPATQGPARHTADRFRAFTKEAQ